MQPHLKLSVWRKSHELTIRVFEASMRFPRDSVPLDAMVRHAAQAIPTNIAEGRALDAGPEFARHLAIARGKARRLECLLLIARRLDFLDQTEHAKLEARTDEVYRMLESLRRTIVGRAAKPARNAQRAKSPG